MIEKLLGVKFTNKEMSEVVEKLRNGEDFKEIISEQINNKFDIELKSEEIDVLVKKLQNGENIDEVMSSTIEKIVGIQLTQEELQNITNEIKNGEKVDDIMSNLVKEKLPEYDLDDSEKMNSIISRLQSGENLSKIKSELSR